MHEREICTKQMTLLRKLVCKLRLVIVHQLVIYNHQQSLLMVQCL